MPPGEGPERRDPHRRRYPAPISRCHFNRKRAFHPGKVFQIAEIDFSGLLFGAGQKEKSGQESDGKQVFHGFKKLNPAVGFQHFIPVFVDKSA